MTRQAAENHAIFEPETTMTWEEIDPALIERIVQKTLKAPFQNVSTDPEPVPSMSTPALLRWQPVSTLGKTPPMPDYTFRPFNFTDREENPQTIQSVTKLAASRFQADPAHAGLATKDHRYMTTDKPLSYNPVLSVQRVSQCQKKGDTMVDLSGYKDLTKPPAGTESGVTATLDSTTAYEKESETEHSTMTTSTTTSPITRSSGFSTQPEIGESDYDSSSYADYTGNVRTLLKLVSDLPAEVTKQSGAQVIRLTMEAMGISMENVLSEAQSAQSDLLDGVRTNIKKIEEYKTVIRKLESEIKSLQGKANELSEIIDLFILSNATPNLVEKVDSSY